MANPKMWVVQLRRMTQTTHPVPHTLCPVTTPKWDAEEHLQHHPSALPTLHGNTDHGEAISLWDPPTADDSFPHGNKIRVPTPLCPTLCNHQRSHTGALLKQLGALACALAGTGRPMALAPGVPHRPRLPFGVVPQLLLMI